MFAFLLACVLGASARAQDAQDAQEQEAQDAPVAEQPQATPQTQAEADAQRAPARRDTTWHAPDPPPEEESADESADGGDEDADDESSEEEPQARGDDGEFQPSEKIRADSALSFPADIWARRSENACE
jgi:hypothetical protein